MASEVIENLDRIPMSEALASTLARAAEYASSQSHVEVTLEHLLLALTEDADAEIVLATSNVDIGHLKSGVAEQLGRIEERLPLDQSTTTQISQTVTRILEASAQAASGRRAQINGAIVLAAIVGDGNSTAAHLLRAQGLTFEAAIKALQSSLGEPGSPAQHDHAGNFEGANDLPPEAKRDPSATSADDFLAEARATVRSRVTTGRPKTAPAAGSSSAPSPSVGKPTDPTPTPTAKQPEPASKKVTEIDAERPPVDGKPNATPPPPPPAAAVTEKTESAPPAAPDSWAPAKPATTQQPPPQPRPMRPPPPLATNDPTTARPTQTGRPNHPAQPAPGQQYPLPNQGQPQRPVPQGHVPPMSQQPGHGPRTQPAAGAPGSPVAPQQRPGAPAPAARGPGVPWPAPPGQARRQQSQPGQDRAPIEDGQLVENIPRKMQVEVPALAEVTIARADVKNLAGTLSGQAPAHRHEIAVTKAMSVRLRAPKGGFYIESASPETQWLESTLGIETDEFARWRWTVTPKTRGKKPLQVIVSARTMGADGMIAESALPDQVIEVKVRANLTKNTKRLVGWTIAAIAGGLLARFGEQIWETSRTLLQTFTSGS